MMPGKILYFSTNGNAPPVNFSEALLKGLAPDNGLYMPDHIPVLSYETWVNLSGKSYPEIAFTIVRNFLEGEITDSELHQLTLDAYNFEVPLEKVYDRKYIMRLDQGPTASFKDFAARMMGRLMQYFLQRQNRKMLILTATSGDTGSAIASAFYGLDNIEVVILFPEKEVTPRQRKQMTTLKKNIKTISLQGKFDDCQALVKQAFMDQELAHLELSSANSINIGRLIPQSIYYFYAWTQLASVKDAEPVVFSVPSGNFGNMMGGLLAKRMGLPVRKFVIATNENDEVPVYWRTGYYNTIIPSRNCISSAMNVGHPSNMARVIALYGGIMDEKGNITREPDIRQMRKDIYAVSISDNETTTILKETYRQYGVLLEPHGAAGWAGLKQYLKDQPSDNDPEQLAICLETANPAKFPEEIRNLLGIEPELPPSMEGLDLSEESYDKLNNDYAQFRDYLKDRY
ncbi:MAG: threonine synthase [Bacteroidales bacterium]|nr:threonine synthase [Bacteroidales bacterium]